MEPSTHNNLKKRLSKIVFESSLIIFSVLLALVLNEYIGKMKADKEKARALQMIKIELNENMQILNRWIPYHEQVIENFNTAIKNFNSDKVTDDSRMFILKLMPNGVIQEMVSRSAWEALQQSSSRVSLDIETTFVLAKAYRLQELSVETTILNFINIMNDRESMKPNNLRETLYLMRSSFQELMAQEKNLVFVYQQTLDELSKSE
ncbi:hypothetical protein CWB72_19480 [Pseudoalteromonas phenolica]|nr:hypothetical protein CWB72_19480 [Pseudoalteromonas phenolica]